ncbi:hypothetical protein PR002_g8610 [Phytophthora rubi]|uniref:ABC transporter domain-containing protein n=1 Tax=Phytophthora rubi TaxID=129364 RepID=A0A6A3N006_9STRA|nr:hypothetical protein PR002_g8610 [Phytophthora rubi]
MAKEDKRSLLQPEAPAATEEVPQVYRSLNFRSLQEPYSNRSGDTMASHYSTLRADNLDSMLNGGLERFYKKYNHLSRKINLQLPTPEVRFQDLSFSVQVPASVACHNTVGSHLSSIFTPWQKVPMMTKHALHPMTGIIKPGSMTLILANPGAGKSTFLKAMAGKLQDNKQTDIGGEILYSGLRGEEIDLIKLVGLVDQMDNHIPTLTVRETFKFADMCVNGRPEDQPEEMRDIAALRTELFLQILGLESCAETVVGDALLRGVSGGERKRVTVGEVLVGGQSLFLCDEISTGLDSAATFDIVKSMLTSGRGHRYANGSVEAKNLPVTAEELNNLFCQSDIYKKTHEAISTGFNEHQFENAEDFKKAKSVANLARSKQNSEFGLAFIPSTMLLLNRQKLIWLRDPPLLWGKLLEALIIGLVMGMIYFNVSSKYYLRMIFFSIALFQRQAWQQITISFQLRKHAISAYMTMLSSLSPSITVGQALASISVSFFLLFSGNIILADLIPDYWIWMYWFSPISWALRSNMLSEFSSDRYTADEGKKFLDSFSIKQGTGYIWFGIGVLAFYYFLFTTLNGLALHFIRYEKYKGVSVKTMTDNTTSHEEVYVEVGTPSAPNGAVVKSGGLPFTPSNLCIKDLEYFVTLPSGEEKQLLRGITAHFEPGRMVALMGATGAGKTTLMDVMAGRKTGGRIVGDIIVNDDFVRHSTLNYKPIATGFWNQLGQLAKKQQLTYWRNPQYNFMRMFLFPLFAIIFGTTFYLLSATSVKKINSHIGLIYNSMDFIGVINLMTVLEVTCAERAVFYRERMSNYYGPLPYSLSLWFAEVPYLIVVIVLFVTIEYWLVGWNDNAGDFFFFMFVFYLYTSACTYVGQWMSALMPNEKVANVAVGALSCLFNLFSGYLLPRTSMKHGYKWFQYLMPSSYSLAALVGVQFGNNQDIIAVTANNVTKQMTVSDYIANTYDFRPAKKYDFMAGLIVIWIVLQVAIYLTFKYVSHLKR